jgi:lysozyme
VTEKGRQYLLTSEGVRSKAYVDEAGLLTIGIGHLLTAEEIKSGVIHIGTEAVEYSKGLTEAQIYQLLDQDCLPKERIINSVVKVDLTDHQRDALVSFAFNIGIHAFETSTLVRLLNQGDYNSVPAQMRRWNKVHVDGELVASVGLSARREREIELWNS